MSFDGSWHMYRSMTRDRSVSSRKVNRVLVRRILGYARKYRGLIVVFLLLAAQFEKWTIPVAVVLTVPVAVFGALALTWAVGLDNDVYFQVGLVTLGLLTAHGLLRNTSLETVAARMPRSLLAGIWTVMIGGLILNQGNGNAFIYFQF